MAAKSNDCWAGAQLARGIGASRARARWAARPVARPSGGPVPAGPTQTRQAIDLLKVFGYYHGLSAILRPVSLWRSLQGIQIGSSMFRRLTRVFAGRPGGFFKDSTMYAVIKTGGKQYRVVAGEKLKVEQIPADIGQEIVLDQVLMLGGESVVLGSPLVAGAKVTAKVISHGRGEKVRIFKLRRRKHYQKHQGHRQNYTEIEISAINA